MGSYQIVYQQREAGRAGSSEATAGVSPTYAEAYAGVRSLTDGLIEQGWVETDRFAIGDFFRRTIRSADQKIERIYEIHGLADEPTPIETGSFGFDG